MPAPIVQVSPAPTGADLSAVYVDGKGAVYIGGASGVLLKSTDHGATWTPLATRSTADIHGLWGVGGDVYAGADGDVVLVSNDGGATWKASAPKTGRSTAIEGGAALKADDVTAVGVNGVIVHTADRGKTWTVENTEAMGYQTFYGACYAPGHITRFVVGESGSVAQVYDGKWLGGGRPGGGSYHAVVTTPDGFVAVGDGGRITQFDLAGAPKEVKGETDRILHGAWNADRAIVAVGETYTKLGATRATIERSIDGGATWKLVDSAVPDHHLRAIAGTAKDLWAVGDGGAVVRSTDAGEHWASIGARVLPDQPVLSITSADHGKTLVATGGAVARSTDGGKTWKKVIASSPALATTIPGGLLVADPRAGIFKSTDAGATWKPIAPAPRLPIWSAIASSGATVMLLDMDNKIALSQDAGATWTSASVAVKGALRTGFANGGDLWLAGDDGAVARSTDKGKTWAPVAVKTSEPLGFHAGWTDGAKVIALAGSTRGGGMTPSRAHVVVSTDGGSTWTERDIPDHFGLLAMSGGAGAIVAVGDRGGAIVTRDGGRSWTPLPFATPNTQTAVWTDGATIVVGSEHGELWRGAL